MKNEQIAIPSPTINEMQKWANASGVKLDHNIVQIMIWSSQWGWGRGYEQHRIDEENKKKDLKTDYDFSDKSKYPYFVDN
jgi:hypothetical protein